jgi:branched-chain amino acid transport system permease protein
MAYSAVSPAIGEFRASRRSQAVLAAVVLIVAALPAWFVHDPYTMNVLILTLLYAALSQSWNILGGYCGQISLGHALYFGTGAYATSILYVKAGILPWFGLVAGGLLAAAIALALGAICFRLAGHYFTIATIVLAEIGLTLVQNWEFAGAALGIQWPIGPDSWASLQFARDKVPYLFFVLGLYAVTWMVSYLIEDSRWGYWWRAVKDDPAAGESLGVTVFPSKMMAAAISAFFTAVGGGFYAAFLSYIDPESVMSFRFSLLMALPAVLGALVLSPLSEFTRSAFGGTGTGTDLIIYGVMIMAIALIRPEGLQSLVPRSMGRRAS